MTQHKSLHITLRLSRVSLHMPANTHTDMHTRKHTHTFTQRNHLSLTQSLIPLLLLGAFLERIRNIQLLDGSHAGCVKLVTVRTDLAGDEVRVQEGRFWQGFEEGWVLLWKKLLACRAGQFSNALTKHMACFYGRVGRDE